MASFTRIPAGNSSALTEKVKTIGSNFTGTDITIPITGWTTDTSTGFFSLTVTVNGLTANDEVDLNLDATSITKAQNCVLKSVVTSGTDKFTIYSEYIPTETMTGTLYVRKAVS